MRNRNGSNVLLVEILIAVLFFMLSATVLVQVFATSRNLTHRSGVETAALAEAQNIAEALYAAEDPDAALKEREFILSHDAWSKDYGDFSLYITSRTQETETDEMWLATVSAFYMEKDPSVAMQEHEQLFELPCARFKGVRS